MPSAMINDLLGLDEDEDASDRVLYSYNTIFNGFAAKLTPSQVEILMQRNEILAITPDTKFHLHTTRTPKFLGLDGEHGVWTRASTGNDVIVGVLDSGIWPESPSFSDSGMKPVPTRWKGECESGVEFNSSHCNKKLIGARFFYKGYEAGNGPMDETKEYKSPRDKDGHGTHTSSTAGGSFTKDASLLGYARGTASGAAPGARIAMYKVCWTDGCVSSDILAGMNSAIADGVDILSLSLGGASVPYDADAIAMGAFSAVQKGIFVSASAGNSGPTPMTVANVAPWITTVGAGTLDRNFPATVILGNGASFQGASLYSGEGLPKGKMVPLISGNAASNGNSSSRLCLEGTLDPALVKGKIVICERGISTRVGKGYVVKSAGGLGMILANNAGEGDELVADSHVLPAATVGYNAKKSIQNYINSTKDSSATIEFNGTVIGVKPSPIVAAFSSRGPNTLTAEILKPDLIGPGVDILAAWTGATGPSSIDSDTRRVKFNIVSGTSMSCPHVSGIAALIKAAQPTWSPAAIRSALMTTAYTVDNTGKPLVDVSTGRQSTPFDHGAGHVDPLNALDPGLIYDMGTQDYVDFLCTLRYTRSQIRTLTRTNATCSPKARRRTDPGNINYPSFSIVFPNSGANTTVKHTRTVTNVGGAAATYNYTVSAPPTVKIMVRPKVLAFKGPGEKQSYSLRFTSKVASTGTETSRSFGSITWSDGLHVVKSPIAFSWQE